MKLGMNLLLWSNRINESHYSTISNLKNFGFDEARRLPMGGERNSGQGVGLSWIRVDDHSFPAG